MAPMRARAGGQVLAAIAPPTPTNAAATGATASSPRTATSRSPAAPIATNNDASPSVRQTERMPRMTARAKSTVTTTSDPLPPVISTRIPTRGSAAAAARRPNRSAHTDPFAFSARNPVAIAIAQANIVA
jgi:hypothetical protein